jgi:hypothetical protein
MGRFNKDAKDAEPGFIEVMQDRWYDFVQFLREAWILLLLLFVGLVITWWFIDPPPPRHVILATGSAGGEYQALGKQYAEFFAKRHITLELLPTNGAQENINHLADREDSVQAAFVQAGVVNPKDSKGIQSLGSISYEPIWFFYRGPVVEEGHFEALHGRLKYFANSKISVGIEGSGTHAQAMHILQASGLDQGKKFVYLPGAKAVKALQNGEIDGVFIADGIESENIQALLKDPSLHLVGIKRAGAYVHALPFLRVLSVPEGGFDLIRNFPSKDIQLLATTTQLLIDDRMHPAIQFLFLEAAKEINGRASFFAERGEFPSFKDSTFPESPVAIHFEEKGAPLLMEYLPFWLAELVNRLFVVLLPFCAVGYPLLLALPSYRERRVRVRIHWIYSALKKFEGELITSYDPAKCDEYLAKIDLMEYKALKLEVSKGTSGDYYTLRTSIDYVRNCLNRGTHPYQTGLPDEIPS